MFRLAFDRYVSIAPAGMLGIKSFRSQYPNDIKTDFHNQLIDRRRGGTKTTPKNTKARKGRSFIPPCRNQHHEVRRCSKHTNHPSCRYLSLFSFGARTLTGRRGGGGGGGGRCWCTDKRNERRMKASRGGGGRFRHKTMRKPATSYSLR